MKHIFTLAFLAASVAMYAQVGIITWEVNMANETVDPTGVYLAGGDYFGSPGDNPMADDDGDGIWSISIAMPMGYTGAYTFTNGACADWSCKENIVGQSCAFGTWSDRELPEVTGDATYSTCFAQCTTDGTCAALTDIEVTFRVDMSEVEVTAGVNIFGGSINGWGIDATPMTDDDGDNIYEHTMVLPGGFHEYKFVNSGAEEAFDDSTYTECTLTSGAFTNRVLEVSGTDPITTEAYCYNSCSACQDTTGGGGGPFDVTFNVNMANEEVDPTGVFLAGGMDFGSPGDNPMTDDDGDGIYTITKTLAANYTGHYTFTNGACGDWSCKENLAGLPCGDPSNYNDRMLGPITSNTTISTCFGQCSTDGSCETISVASVTFRVDMSQSSVTGDVTVFGGSINGWNNTATPLTDDDGDGIYEVTVELDAGGHEYKFVNSGAEEVFDPIVHGACTVTTADSVYTNRYLLIEGSNPVTTEAYCFNSCDPCIADGIEELEVAGFDLIPSVTNDEATMRFPIVLAIGRDVNIVSFSGALVEQFRIPAGVESWNLNTAGYAPGIYFVNAQSAGLSATRKLVVIQ